jgi:hypothetical protein
MKRLFRLAVVAVVAVGWQIATPPAALAKESPEKSASQTCDLGNGVQHVVNVVFDNTHFSRDNPNVPSDLEQMPALLNFIKGQGTLLTNQHTPLIAHTATDILTGLTGVYGDQMGVPVSNNYIWYKANSQTALGFSFAYWTDKVGNGTFNMLSPAGKNAPAPWVPFTRAGCDVGGVSTANIELESSFNIPTVFGTGSPEAAEAAASAAAPRGTAANILAQTDFVGIAIHCAQGGGICNTSANARPDVLPDEPGGYTGFTGLFGAKYVDPAITNGHKAVKATNGLDITDPFGQPGFPGFDGMPAQNSLGYAAQMLERGVQVTYAYISDAHAAHTPFTDPNPWASGEANYVAQLKSYNTAFDTFFKRLAKAGITRKNTVFTFTSDEGDHMIAGPPSPANCDGVNVPCTYATKGEVSANLPALIAAQSSNTTAFDFHFDSAPTISIEGNPTPTSAATRDLEHVIGNLTATNPYSGVNEKITNFLADRAEMNLLHMLTVDPNRDPTFTMFAKPDYFFSSSNSSNNKVIDINPGFNWNHGDIAPEINTTWLGIVGPDVRHLGMTGRVWTDHADIRPTLMALTGLQDDYTHQGRPITEVMSGDVAEEHGGGNLRSLAAIYKQINAPVGQLSLDSLRFATKATLSNSAGDQTYLSADIRIAGWTVRRDALAGQMIRLLDTTGPSDSNENSDDSNAHDLIAQARRLLAEVHAAAA